MINQETGSRDGHAPMSIIIPTYRRERVLVDTIRHLAGLRPAAAEILVVDQTPQHEPQVERALNSMERSGTIRRIRLPRPSITRAMNVGLKQASEDTVLFLDDDIVPGKTLVAAHAKAHSEGKYSIVAGQVLQPGEEPLAQASDEGHFRFCSSVRQPVSELMAGNFSIRRQLALALGGFDENFVRVAYRFEAEFSERALAAGEQILFEPEASIRHLRVSTGGTRSYGTHGTTLKPGHTVGAYYYLLRSRTTRHSLLKILSRPFVGIRSRHHLGRPWWIPVTLVAELCGLAWAVRLAMRGPRLLEDTVCAVANDAAASKIGHRSMVKSPE